MHYFEVWVSSPRYHRSEPLTYSYAERLKPGSLVAVPLKRERVAALVVKEVNEPRFATKKIVRKISDSPLPRQLYDLIVWMKDYYPAPMGQLMALILPNGIATKSRSAELAKSQEQAKAKALPELTPEQGKVLAAITAQKPQPILIHGDTGSGKTRVYLEMAKLMLNQGRSTMLLTPEIGLTPQLARVCEAAFPGRSVVIHSNLSPKDRRDAWLRVLESSEPLVIVGARSALFAPVNNLGLIVIDESHETTYKQEQTPYYLTSRVAGTLAKLHQAYLLFGSATPSIADYYTFEQKGLPILNMRESALGTLSTPDVNIIDIKQRELFTRSPWMADALIDEVAESLRRGEQSLLFLNRRGSARMILCQKCGWQALCKNCDVSMTYHSDTQKLCCHICGNQEKTPVNCKDCGSHDIIFRVIGTKSLVSELERLFQGAKIGRYDSDTKKNESLEQQYEEIRAGDIDLLVGTQMLGKGLDLPKLAVLGVVLADTSLSFPDYTAEERTFQLLTQVMGRVNRGHVPGKVYVQTYSPDSNLLNAAIRKDYPSFYSQQVTERQHYGFPPFRHVLKLGCDYAQQAKAKQVAGEMVEKLHRTTKDIEVVGPSPAFVEKARGRYRWQIIVKSADRSRLLDVVKQLPANWTYDIDPINLL